MATSQRPWCPIRLRASTFIRRDGTVLLVQDPVYRQGCWILPGGGVNPYESAAQGAEREVREETNLTVRVEGILKIREILENEVDLPELYGGTRRTIDLVFRAVYLSGTIDTGHNPEILPDGIPRIRTAEWVPFHSVTKAYQGIPVYPYELLHQIIEGQIHEIPLSQLCEPLLDLR